MGSPTISMQKTIAASQGNPDLREVLDSLSQVSKQTQTVTSTTPISGNTAGQQNSSAARPAQATGTVSLLNGSYIVQLVNPGGQSAISQLQSAQQSQNATAQTSLQPVTPIYHQIRVSTSSAFNVNSNTQTFGGNTGSTQTFWTITGLGSGTWYFQFRSSYDGINFNTWRNANSGSALGGLVNEVTEENTGNANWALFTAPGKTVMGIGQGFCSDGETLVLARQLYSSGMFAIAGPNGYTPKGNSTYGVTFCDVDLVVPTLPVVGTPDLPVVIKMEYGQAHAAPNYWPGTATVFALAVDPTSENVKFFTAGASSWMEMRLPGGAHIAIGQGRNYDAETLPVPPELTWFDWSRSISISTFTDAIDTGNTPWGFKTNQIVSGVLSAEYADATYTWSTTANWLVIAFQQGADVDMSTGWPFLKIALQGGHEVIIGAGVSPVGNTITLPVGFAQENMLGICTPAGFVPSGNHFQGIQQCGFVGLSPILTYLDDSGHTWSGPCNWLVACWR